MINFLIKQWCGYNLSVWTYGSYLMFTLCDEMTVKSHRWQEQCSECKPSDRCLLWLKVEACTCVWIISLITRGKLKIITPVDLKTKQCIWIQLTVLVLWFINLGAARCIVANTWKWPQTRPSFFANYLWWFVLRLHICHSKIFFNSALWGCFEATNEE